MQGLKVLQGIMDNLMGNINSCTLGQIESFNPEQMKAQVTPLVNNIKEDGSIERKPLLIEVPVALIKAGPFFIRPPYESGDLVLIAFADNDIDNVILTGETSVTNSKRVHSLDDAIVVSGINSFNNILPSEYKEDLLIAHKDMDSFLAFTSNGDIEIQANNIKIIGKKKVSIKGPITSESW